MKNQIDFMKLTLEQQKILVDDASFFVAYFSYDNYWTIHGRVLSVEEFFNLKKEKFLHLLIN